MSQPISIGSDRQLFVDALWIDRSHGITRRLHEPARCEIAIAPDYPWERGGVSYMVTFPDSPPGSASARFRAWYRCDCEMPPQDKRIPLIAYAESDDGIHWYKPILHLIEYDGSTENNLVWAGPGNNMAPFRDGRSGIPDDERYKAFVRDAGIRALASPDGLRWRLLQEEPVLTEGPFDSHNIVFWDAWRHTYVAYTRGVAGSGNFKGGVRWIRRATSSDFRIWSSLEPLDMGETPFEHLYTNACVRYERAPGIYLMFPSRFIHDREPVPDWPYGPGVNDIVFMSSRDGLHFDRSFMHAFVRPGPDPGNWHERGIFMECGILHTSPTEMSLYGMENWRLPGVRIRRYTLRTDGFVSVNAGYHGGECVTPPLTFAGSEVRLNYSTSAVGSVRVEIQDADGHPIPGRTLDDCPPRFGDETDGVMRWQQGTDVSALAGTPVRLRFAIKDTDLYAFRFCTPGREA